MGDTRSVFQQIGANQAELARRIEAGSPFAVRIAFDFNQADASVLYTFPAGFNYHLFRLYWEVTTSFTGGASSAIGVSSDDADYNTKGDLLGGSGGDVLATLVSTGRVYKGGTIGTKFGTNGECVVAGGKVLRFDRIVSAFTAGVGFIHCLAQPIAV